MNKHTMPWKKRVRRSFFYDWRIHCRVFSIEKKIVDFSVWNWHECTILAPYFSDMWNEIGASPNKLFKTNIKCIRQIYCLQIGSNEISYHIKEVQQMIQYTKKGTVFSISICSFFFCKACHIMELLYWNLFALELRIATCII